MEAVDDEVAEVVGASGTGQCWAYRELNGQCVAIGDVIFDAQVLANALRICI